MVYWTTIYTFIIYWGFGLIYTVMDLTNRPKFLRRYKIQANTNEPVDTKKLIKVILSVIFNQIFVGIPFAILSFYAMKLRGMPDVRELPTFHWVLFEIGICILVEEFGFYYSHRLMHSKKIYKHIHKQHHLWQSPVAVTAIYAHPIGKVHKRFKESKLTHISLSLFINRTHLQQHFAAFFGGVYLPFAYRNLLALVYNGIVIDAKCAQRLSFPIFPITRST